MKIKGDCKDCPHTVGDAYERDCAFPDCWSVPLEKCPECNNHGGRIPPTDCNNCDNNGFIETDRGLEK